MALYRNSRFVNRDVQPPSKQGERFYCQSGFYSCVPSLTMRTADWLKSSRPRARCRMRLPKTLTMRSAFSWFFWPSMSFRMPSTIECPWGTLPCLKCTLTALVFKGDRIKLHHYPRIAMR